MNEPDDTKVSIPLDGKTAGEVSRLAREFGAESDSEMLKWLVNHGRRDLDDFLKLRTRLVEVLGEWTTLHGCFDGREEIRLRVTLGEPELRRAVDGHGYRREYWTVESEVRVMPAFPEPRQNDGETLEPGASGYKDLEFFTHVWFGKGSRSDRLDGLRVGLFYSEYSDLPPYKKTLELVFEELTEVQLNEIFSSIGREFDLVRRVDEVARLPVGWLGSGSFGPRGNHTPATRAKVEPPDPDTGP